jgi:hypothetical protein
MGMTWAPFGCFILACAFAVGAEADVRLLSPAWKEAPTLEDVRAATPADGGGRAGTLVATLQCQLESDGTLADCVKPPSRAFLEASEKAALSLAPHFRAWVPPEVNPTKEKVVVSMTFNFHIPATSTPLELTDPEYLTTSDANPPPVAFPDEAAKAGDKSGMAIVECLDGPDGVLSDCSAVVETPKGVGFGRNAVAALVGARLNPWQNGEPVVGRRIRIPVFFGPPAAPDDGSIVHRGLIGDDGVYYYPDRADQMDVDGVVVLECIFAAKGRLNGCTSVSETPDGLGFADAAKRMAGLGIITLAPTGANANPGDQVWVAVTFGPELRRHR